MYSIYLYSGVDRGEQIRAMPTLNLISSTLEMLATSCAILNTNLMAKKYICTRCLSCCTHSSSLCQRKRLREQPSMLSHNRVLGFVTPSTVPYCQFRTWWKRIAARAGSWLRQLCPANRRTPDNNCEMRRVYYSLVCSLMTMRHCCLFYGIRVQICACIRPMHTYARTKLCWLQFRNALGKRHSK